MRQFLIHFSRVLVLLAAAAVSCPTPKAAAHGDDLAGQIIQLLANPDREFRAAALEQVRSAADGAEQTRLFADQLPKLEASAQAELIAALADRGDATARPALVELLSASNNEDVRAAALAALGEIGSVEDLPTLVKALKAPSPAEQQAAQTALRRMRGEAVVQKLAAEVKAADANTRAELVNVLAARRAASQMPVFLAASVDDDGRVRSAAMTALGQLAGPDQLPALIPAVLKAQKGGERDSAERHVAEVAARIENADRRGDALIAAINQVDAAQRDELLSLVGRVGGQRLIDFVGQIATGGDAARRRLAIDALSKWPDASAADKLLEIANHAAESSKSEPGEREQAFEGYVKLSATRDGRSDRQRLERMKQAMQAARTAQEKSLVINRCRTAYSVDTLRFVLPYVTQDPFAQIACETIVELAHHREIRDPNKAEFHKALDQVIKISKDPVVVDRAGRYQRGETWERPKK